MLADLAGLRDGAPHGHGFRRQRSIAGALRQVVHPDLHASGIAGRCLHADLPRTAWFIRIGGQLDPAFRAVLLRLHRGDHRPAAHDGDGRIGEVLPDEPDARTGAALDPARCGLLELRSRRRGRPAVGRVVVAERSVEAADREGLAIRREARGGRPIGLLLQRGPFVPIAVGPEDLHRTVVRGGKQRPSIRAEAQPQDGALVREFRERQFSRAFLGVGAHRVDTDAVVAAAGDEQPAVGRPSDGVQFLQRLAERLEPFTGGDIVEFRGAVGARAGEHLAVGPEREVVDGALARGDGLADGAVRDVPEPDGVVVAAGRQRASVGRDGDGVERVAMPLEDADDRAGPDIPLADLAGDPRITRRREHGASVRSKGDSVHRAARAAEDADDRAGIHFDEIDLAMPCDREKFCRGREGQRMDAPAGLDLGCDPRHLDLGSLGGGLRRRRAGIDPRPEERDLLRLELVAFARGHELVLAGLAPVAEQRLHEQRIRGLAGHDDRAGFAAFHEVRVRFQDEPAFRILRAVALDAMLLEQRLDVGEPGRGGAIG